MPPPPVPWRGRTVFLSAGEASGDLHGAGLALALRRRDPSLRLVGIGGHRMQKAGVERITGLEKLGVMGLSEVIRHLPRLLSLQRRVRAQLSRPGAVDLFVPIDFPEFHLPLAATAKRAGVPVLYYVPPQVWAWRERRVRRLARSCDLACVILPFEEPFLRPRGVNARFVGHPLLDQEPALSWHRASFARSGPRRSARDSRPVLALFPGSRQQEIARLLGPFQAAAELARREIPELEVVVARAPGLPETAYGNECPARLVRAAEACSVATAAITKSGSVTLELALAGVPMVVGYRLSRLSYAVARRLVRVEQIALVNLVAEQPVVPELIQAAATPAALAERVLPLLDLSSAARRRALEALVRIRERLGEPGAAARVAACGLSLINEGR